MTKVSDEMLMAYVDGELDGAAAEDIRRATERDPALARRAEAFRSSRRYTRDALSGIKAEPLPAPLIETVLGSANANTAPKRRLAAIPLAASLAVLAGLGGYWLAQQSAPPAGSRIGDQAVADALGALPAGAERSLATGRGTAHLKSLATYRVEGGLCRTFELAEAGESLRGVGCARDGSWRIHVTVTAPAAESFVPASDGAPAAIDAFLDALDAEGPLSAEDEAALTAR